MLGGQRAFGGKSASDILAAVIKLDPDWSALPKKTPAPIRRLIRRCLTKERRQRLRAIGDVRIVIEECLSGAPPEIAEPAPGGRSIVPGLVVCGLAVALAILGWRATRPINPPLMRLDMDLGPEVALPNLERDSHNLILSPDRARLVYRAGKTSRLYTRRLDQSKVTELPGTDGAIRPFLSPDGQ
jgi:serine/threonine-protein kinase